MIGLIQPVTRRSILLSLLIAPLACLGCGMGGATVDTTGGEKRRKRVQELEKKAEMNRNSGKKKGP